MGDFNIRLLEVLAEEFCDNFILTNVLKDYTLYTKNNKSAMDFLLIKNQYLFRGQIQQKQDLAIAIGLFHHV